MECFESPFQRPPAFIYINPPLLLFTGLRPSWTSEDSYGSQGASRLLWERTKRQEEVGVICLCSPCMPQQNGTGREEEKLFLKWIAKKRRGRLEGIHYRLCYTIRFLFELLRWRHAAVGDVLQLQSATSKHIQYYYQFCDSCDNYGDNYVSNCNDELRVSCI